MPLSTSLLVALLSLTVSASPQQITGAHQPLVITWFGPGAITLPPIPKWKPELVSVYDQGTRPVIQMTNAKAAITASFIVFENASGQPNASGCRKDVIDLLVEHGGKLVTSRKDSDSVTPDKVPLALTSYELPLAGKVKQLNLFAFAGDTKTCLEMHLSKVEADGPADRNLRDTLVIFRPMLGYQPSGPDYLFMGNLLFGTTPPLAAPYLKEALERNPSGKDSLDTRRFVTDRLVMSLGMDGDLKNSRAVATQAIEQDPDYPLNYYNLACADAEEGNAPAARTHLEQAFARKANVLPGESLPDPAKDDSLLKLKSNQPFWAYVLTLSK